MPKAAMGMEYDVMMQSLEKAEQNAKEKALRKAAELAQMHAEKEAELKRQAEAEEREAARLEKEQDEVIQGMGRAVNDLDSKAENVEEPEAKPLATLSVEEQEAEKAKLLFDSWVRFSRKDDSGEDRAGPTLWFLASNMQKRGPKNFSRGRGFFL